MNRTFVFAMLLVGACDSIRLRGSSTATGFTPLPSPTSENPTRIPRAGEASVRSGGPLTGEVRRVCRGARAAGWIAIDYVADTVTCGRNAKAQYPVALVVAYDRTAVGQLLEVCAGERVPRNWVREQYVHDDLRCPDEAPTADPGKQRVMVIRRTH